MITIERNLDGTWTLDADGAKMIFESYELAKQFVLDYADGEIKTEIES